MAENFGGGNLEAEIAELTRQIEAKKRSLEAQSGIVRENRELVSETVSEHFYPTAPTVAPAGVAPAASTPVPVASDDYLSSLPPEQVETLNRYISMVPTQGIKTTINKVVNDDPFIIDAFHDALVTRLYDELKSRGIIK